MKLLPADNNFRWLDFTTGGKDHAHQCGFIQRFRRSGAESCDCRQIDNCFIIGGNIYQHNNNQHGIDERSVILKFFAGQFLYQRRRRRE